MPPDLALPDNSCVSNRYRVLHPLGGGAMSRVYKVEHIELGTLHALKVQADSSSVSSPLEPIPEFARREARLLTTLSHPRLPRVTDFFREDDRVYLVMDYVEGQNLKAFLEAHGREPLPCTDVMGWGIQVCEILTYLHSRTPPVIFRDIKPANLIRRPDDTICLVDFGIARQVRRGAATDTIVFGSPGYAPPEQYGHGQTDARADLYALGATLHHLLTGQDPSLAPFQWPPPRLLNPQVPRELDRVIRECVEMDMSLRPPSAAALGRSLRAILEIYANSRKAPTGVISGVKMPPPRPVCLEEVMSETTPGLPPAPSGEDEAGTATIPLTADTIPLTRNSRAVAPVPRRPRTAPAVTDPPPLEGDRAIVRTAPPAPRATEAGLLSSLFTARKTSPVRQQRLYRVLLSCALLILLGGALFPFAGEALAPPPNTLAAPPLPARQASVPALAEYARQRGVYRRASTRAEQSRSIYANLSPLRYALDAFVCLTLFTGIVYPMRPTRNGLVLAIGGIAGLICLTAATFLPDRVGLFCVFALLEGLLLLPAGALLAVLSTGTFRKA
jgi:serine/threonine protein kinase